MTVEYYAPGVFGFGSSGGGELFAFEYRDVRAGRILTVPLIPLDYRRPPARRNPLRTLVSGGSAASEPRSFGALVVTLYERRRVIGCWVLPVSIHHLPGSTSSGLILEAITVTPDVHRRSESRS